MRPNLSFLEILKESYRIFKVNIVKILILVLMMVLPLQVLYGIVSDRMNNDESLRASISEVSTIISDASKQENQELDEETTEKLSSLYVDIIKRAAPYFVVFVIISALLLVFSLALAKLTQDEGLHGALNPGYSDGEIVVVYENDEIGEVGTVSDYFTFGLKKLPKYLLALLCFGLVSTSIVSVATIIGNGATVVVFLLLAIFAEVLLPIVAYLGLTGFKAFAVAMRILFRKPVIFGYFTLSSIVSLGIQFGVLYLYSVFGFTGTIDIILSAILSTALVFLLCVANIVPLVYFLDRARRNA